MAANDSALSRYTMIISVQKLTQVIKSNTTGFLRMLYGDTTGKY